MSVALRGGVPVRTDQLVPFCIPSVSADVKPIQLAPAELIITLLLPRQPDSQSVLTFTTPCDFVLDRFDVYRT